MVWIRYKFLIPIIFCFCLSLKAAAQDTFVIRGVISRNISVERIANVLITNLRTREIKMSDQVGWFSINVAKGDTILFSKIEFTDQKVIITAPVDIPVYMQPVIKLQEVTITGQTKKQELNEIMQDYRKQGIYYAGKEPPVTSFLTSPLTGLYELFGKGPQEARRFARDSKSELQYAELRRRYNVPFVKRVLNVTDTVAKSFMQYYTPSYEDLKGWNDYELIKHVKKSYEFYDKAGDKQSLQNLNAPTFINKKDSVILKRD
jgi:hypothetical protein